MAKVVCVVDVTVVNEEVASVVFVVIMDGCVVKSSSVTTDVANAVFVDAVVEKIS